MERETKVKLSRIKQCFIEQKGTDQVRGGISNELGKRESNLGNGKRSLG